MHGVTSILFGIHLNITHKYEHKNCCHFHNTQPQHPNHYYHNTQYDIMSRYAGAIVYTRLGLIIDHLIEVSKKYPSSFTRAQFAEVTKLKESSTGDKLRDMEKYGLINRNDSNYTISASGQAILSGGTARQSEILTAINKVPLWAHLIKLIGKTPERDLFNRTVKGIPEYINLNTEVLGNLWFAYNYDISCITKSPPFSDWSSKVHKSALTQYKFPPDFPQEIEKSMPPESIIKTQLKNQPTEEVKEIKTPVETSHKKEEVMEMSQDRTNNILMVPDISTVPLFIEFGSVRFEAKDPRSIAFARALLGVKDNTWSQ